MRCWIMPMLALVLVAPFVLVARGIQAQGDGKQDLEKLQGKWEIVKIVADGKEEAPRERVVWTISGNKVTYSAKLVDEITLDAGKSPKHIDIRVVREKEPTKTYKGIYALEGDTLRFCVNADSDTRPTAFESKPKSGFRLITLKRVKE